MDEYRGNVLADIDHALSAGKRGLTLTREQLEQLAGLFRDLVEAKNAAVREAERFRRGELTPDEFQRLCHNLDERPGCTRAEFEAGCRAYQEQLFGSPVSGDTIRLCS